MTDLQVNFLSTNNLENTPKQKVIPGIAKNRLHKDMEAEIIFIF